MSNLKIKAIEMISDISDDVVGELIDFIEYLKTKKKIYEYKDLVDSSESSIGFWLNEEDEVWNDV